MKLSSLATAVLILSSIALGQHTASAPPPSPPAAPVFTPPPSPAPSSASSSAPSASASHSSPPSAPAPSVTETHPSTGPAVDHDAERAAVPHSDHPAQEKPREPNAVDSDLHHPKCDEEPCKPESDLRRPICPHGDCACPPGQSAGKHGCVTTVSSNETHCANGMVWNGTACSDTPCPAGQIRIGASCHADCSLLLARAEPLINEIRRVHRQRDDECRQDPSGDLCSQLKERYQLLLARYRDLIAAAGECRSSLPDPDSL
jgi:hypothetical protein